MNRVKRVIHATDSEVAPYTGEGVTVAVLDTGIAMHPDLAGRLAAFHDFCGQRKRPYDDSGHGTHVAGCLCGSGSCSGGLYRGVAPGCRVVAGKVLDKNGDGRVEDMIAGIRYVLATRRLYQTRILSISVGVNQMEEKAGMQKLISWLEEAWDSGLLVVVAAGNKGPEYGSISALGLSPCVVAVGCHDGGSFPDRRHACENYSGRGPEGYPIKKPDLVSPGSKIISCNAFFRMGQSNQVRYAYTEKSGSSMAVPAVSGAAALLWQKYPHATNRQIKERLLLSAKDLGEIWEKQGWGMLHVKNALRE